MRRGGSGYAECDCAFEARMMTREQSRPEVTSLHLLLRPPNSSLEPTTISLRSLVAAQRPARSADGE